MPEPSPELILWLRVQKGEFFNIERQPEMQSSQVRGNGPQYFEIPGSLVQDVFRFLNYDGTFADFPAPYEIIASSVGHPDLTGPIVFNKKSSTSGMRLYISRQNRQAAENIRHPAWTPAQGFPTAPDDVETSEDAAAYIPEGGIRIYVMRMDNGEFRAGFTAGGIPPGLADDDPNRSLYQEGRGGLVDPRELEL
jgi:hypothetical protein